MRGPNPRSRRLRARAMRSAPEDGAVSSVIQDDSSGINAGIIVRTLTVLKCTARRSGVHFNCFAAVLCNEASARRSDRAAARSSARRRCHRVFAIATTYPRCEAPFTWTLPARSPSPRQGTLLGRSGWRDDLTKSQRALANKTRAARSIAIRPRDGTLFRSNVAKMPPQTGPGSAPWVRNQNGIAAGKRFR